jgi:hypothetical protein
VSEIAALWDGPLLALRVERPMSLLKKAFVAFFNRARHEAKLRAALKITTYDVAVGSQTRSVLGRFPRTVAYFKGLL